MLNKTFLEVSELKRTLHDLHEYMR